jgi:hypothetical protein
MDVIRLTGYWRSLKYSFITVTHQVDNNSFVVAFGFFVLLVDYE